MRSHIVVEDLVTCQDWSIRFLESTHNFLSISDFAVQPLHFVIVVLASHGDLSNMLSASLMPLSPKLSPVSVLIGFQTIRYQNLRLLTCNCSIQLKKSPFITRIF